MKACAEGKSAIVSEPRVHQRLYTGVRVPVCFDLRSGWALNLGSASSNVDKRVRRRGEMMMLDAGSLMFVSESIADMTYV